MLVTESMLGADIDICPKCDGAWFDDGELRKASANIPDRLDQLEREIFATEKREGPAFLKCPVDGDTMEPFQYLYKTGIELHSCPTCFGVWIDDGELRAMALALDSAQKDEVSPLAIHQMAAAELRAQHDVEMERHRMFQSVMSVFRMRRRHIW